VQLIFVMVLPTLQVDSYLDRAVTVLSGHGFVRDAGR